MKANQSKDRFTCAEVKRRMRHIKEHLQRFKNQRTLFFAPENHSEIKKISLIDYDCFDEYNYVSTVDFNEEHLINYVKENGNRFTKRDSFKFYAVTDYVDEYRDALQELFSVTCLCLVDKHEKVICKAAICLGSFHHAPRMLYTDYRNRLHFDKLTAYDYLH